jgi:hypothetical protein
MASTEVPKALVTSDSRTPRVTEYRDTPVVGMTISFAGKTSRSPGKIRPGFLISGLYSRWEFDF